MAEEIDYVASIDRSYEEQKPKEPRSYIGASIIGNPCDAALQYSLRGFDEMPPPPRLQRIFALGHMIERMVIRDLRAAKMDVFEIDALTGRQFHYAEYGGHVACNLDSQIFIEDHVRIGEVKSMGDRPFTEFKRDGMRNSHPKYYDQLQMCMGMSGIHKGMLIAYNKNTSEYHIENVEFDQMTWDALSMRINMVLGGARKRVAKDDTDWRCRGCSRADLCWGKRQASERELKRCQSCKFSVPRQEGGWHCSRFGHEATEVCANFELLEPEAR